MKHTHDINDDAEVVTHATHAGRTKVECPVCGKRFLLNNPSRIPDHHRRNDWSLKSRRDTCDGSYSKQFVDTRRSQMDPYTSKDAFGNVGTIGPGSRIMLDTDKFSGQLRPSGVMEMEIAGVYNIFKVRRDGTEQGNGAIIVFKNGECVTSTWDFYQKIVFI